MHSVHYHAAIDTLTKEQRSERMALVRSHGTRPELAVRRLIHSLGYRYRLHRRDLPGTPDLVFPSRRKVIFVHGCFWHRHPGCRNCRMPKSKLDFWQPKLTANRKRDLSNWDGDVKDFTIIGFWPDTAQRFATNIEADSPEEAEIACTQEYPGVAICGVIAGVHDCVDRTEYVEV